MLMRGHASAALGSLRQSLLPRRVPALLTLAVVWASRDSDSSLGSLLLATRHETRYLAKQTVVLQNVNKVRVQLFGEAGCPFTQRFITGKLNWTLSAQSGVDEIVDLEFVPFGNAYFVTQSCGGQGGSYNSEERRCWQRRCGAQADVVNLMEDLKAGRRATDAAARKFEEQVVTVMGTTSGTAGSRPVDCFTGSIVCQHGESECAVNRYLACATMLSGQNFREYMPFVTCVENRYNAVLESGGVSAGAAAASLVEECARQTFLDMTALHSCFEGQDGDAAITEAARRTPDHEGVPYIKVNGRSMAPDTEDEIFSWVCDATGDWSMPPAACNH